jgi:hypothetical protein
LPTMPRPSVLPVESITLRALLQTHYSTAAKQTQAALSTCDTRRSEELASHLWKCATYLAWWCTRTKARHDQGPRLLLKLPFKLAKKHLHGWRPLESQLRYQLCFCLALHSSCMQHTVQHLPGIHAATALTGLSAAR